MKWSRRDFFINYFEYDWFLPSSLWCYMFVMYSGECLFNVTSYNEMITLPLCKTAVYYSVFITQKFWPLDYRTVHPGIPIITITYLGGGGIRDSLFTSWGKLRSSQYQSQLTRIDWDLSVYYSGKHHFWGLILIDNWGCGKKIP